LIKNLIYDVGLHKGEDSEFYLKKGFRVVAVEALPALAQMATERLQGYVASGQLVILDVAIAEKDGPLTFFETPGQSVWGTTNRAWAQRNQRLGQSSIKRTVKGVSFTNILKRYGIPYYLKVDIEGADILCLEALKGFASKPKHVSIESTKTSWKRLREEFALFRVLGYSKFKVVPQHSITAQFCAFPAKEGCYVDHRFEPGSSGQFGEEVPGLWMNEAAALRIYRSIFFRYKLFGDNGFLHRSASVERFLRRFLPVIGWYSGGWYDTHATI
jgi:FkbM family methyltransferase